MLCSVGVVFSILFVLGELPVLSASAAVCVFSVWSDFRVVGEVNILPLVDDVRSLWVLLLNVMVVLDDIGDACIVSELDVLSSVGLPDVLSILVSLGELALLTFSVRAVLDISDMIGVLVLGLLDIPDVLCVLDVLDLEVVDVMGKMDVLCSFGVLGILVLVLGVLLVLVLIIVGVSWVLGVCVMFGILGVLVVLLLIAVVVLDIMGLDVFDVLGIPLVLGKVEILDGLGTLDMLGVEEVSVTLSVLVRGELDGMVLGEMVVVALLGMLVSVFFEVLIIMSVLSTLGLPVLLDVLVVIDELFVLVLLCGLGVLGRFCVVFWLSVPTVLAELGVNLLVVVLNIFVVVGLMLVIGCVLGVPVVPDKLGVMEVVSMLNVLRFLAVLVIFCVVCSLGVFCEMSVVIPSVIKLLGVISVLCRVDILEVP